MREFINKHKSNIKFGAALSAFTVVAMSAILVPPAIKADRHYAEGLQYAASAGITAGNCDGRQSQDCFTNNGYAYIFPPNEEDGLYSIKLDDLSA